MKRNIENELQALRNAVNSLNLIGYRVHELKGKYLLTDNKGTSLTGYWDYVRLNHFIMGYGKAFNNHYQLLEALINCTELIDEKAANMNLPPVLRNHYLKFRKEVLELIASNQKR